MAFSRLIGTRLTKNSPIYVLGMSSRVGNHSTLMPSIDLGMMKLVLMFFFQLDSWYLVIKLDTDMPFIYKFLCQRNQSAKKDCK